MESTARNKKGESRHRLRPLVFHMKLKWSAVLFSLFIVTIIVLADRGELGILKLINQIPLGDKAGHFLLYGILTLLLDLAFLRSRPQSNRSLLVLRIGLILALIIGVEEFSQRYFPSRHSDWVDLTFSYLGVIFFSWLALRIKS